MSKFHTDPFPTDTPSDYPDAAITELFDAILSLKSRSETSAFFRDLLTMPELHEFANRWQTVKMLYTHKSYTDISSALKVSTRTVTRIAHWLYNGFGGYKTVADRMFMTKFKDSHIPDLRYHTGKYTGLKKPNRM